LILLKTIFFPYTTLFRSEKLNKFPNILIFYGLSKIENYVVMVSEWAMYGTLKELYEAYDITWHRKIQIVLDVCRGLICLHKVNRSEEHTSELQSPDHLVC